MTVGSASIYNKGNVPYELTVKTYSKINVLGQKQYIPKPESCIEIKMEDIKDSKKGISNFLIISFLYFQISFEIIAIIFHLIEISGYLMTEIIKIKSEGKEHFFGSITNGIKKIEFNLFEIEITDEIEIGTKLELFGDLELTSINSNI